MNLAIHPEMIENAWSAATTFDVLRIYIGVPMPLKEAPGD